MLKPKIPNFSLISGRVWCLLWLLLLISCDEANPASVLLISPTSTPLLTSAVTMLPTVNIPFTSLPTTLPTTPKPNTPALIQLFNGKVLYAEPGNLQLDTQNRADLIYIEDIGGANRRKIAEGYAPVFSPDGQSIAYLEHPRSGTGKTSIVVLKLDDFTTQTFCSGLIGIEARSLRWSNNSFFLITRPSYEEFGSALYSCAVVSAKATPQLFTRLATFTDKNTTVLDVAPDGKGILWRIGIEDVAIWYNSDLKTLQNKSSTSQKLTNGEYRLGGFGPLQYSSARFSPDGKTVAVAGNGIFFKSVPGQKGGMDAKFYPHYAAPVSSLVWSADGQNLMISIGTMSKSTWLQNLSSDQEYMLAYFERSDWYSKM